MLKEAADRVRKYLASILPVQRRPIMDVRAWPHTIAAVLDVDTVANIIEQAQKGDTLPLFQLYADIISTGSHLQGRLADRKDAVLSDTLSIQPVDKKNPDDVRAAEAVKAMLAEFPASRWEAAMAHLLDATLWPVSLVEKTFQPVEDKATVSRLPVPLRYLLADLTPVPYPLITFITGKLELRGIDERSGFPNAERFVPEPERYLIHRGHLLTAVPDNWGGPMRSIVFWWLLANMSRDWWARFLDRYGTPFVVGKYNQADDAGRYSLERAFGYATKIGGLVISKETEVDIKQAAASDSGDAYKVFIELCNREISKLVSGETLSSDAQAGGMNSDNASAHMAKREEKRAADARRLAATLREQLFKQFLAINGIPGRAPLPIWGSVSAAEQEAMADVLDALSGAGLEVADEALPTISERFGLPVQRKAATPAFGAGGVTPFSADGTPLKKKADASVDIIAEAGAVDLAKVFVGELAPIRGIILASESPEQAMRDVLAFCARFEPGKAARVMEDAMLAMAANGCVATAK